jgi:hypothetical protein
VKTLEVGGDSLFTVVAVRKLEPTQLVMIRLSWERLTEDILIPYETPGEIFFIDGAPVKATDLDRLKILLQGPSFDGEFRRLHMHLRTQDIKGKEMYAKQYPVFLNALLQAYCQDVTSQVISAFRTKVKPRLKDYLPEKKDILDAGIKLLSETFKTIVTT